MKGLTLVLMILMLCQGSIFNGSQYNHPVSSYDLEIGKWEYDSTHEWTIRKTDYLGPVCLQIYTRANEKMEDRVYFYVFDNDELARQAFQDMPNHMYCISENEEDHILGCDEGVCDAEIESLRFLDGNVIIYAQIASYGCWGLVTDDFVPPTRDEELLEYVKEHHEYLRDYANQTLKRIIDEKNK